MGTIIKLGSALTNPTGVKLQKHVVDYPQTLLRHDFKLTKTYPGQATPVPVNTEFVNLATAGGLTNEGLMVSMATVAYASASKSIALGSVSGQLKFGASAAPYPLLGIGGQTTDLLILLTAKPLVDDTTIRPVLEHSSTKSTGTSLEKMQFFMSYGFEAGKLNMYGLGASIPPIDFAAGKWHSLALYIRCDTYNGKAGLVAGYRNGVQVSQRTTNVPTAFFPTDNTIPLILGTNPNANCSIGTFSIIKGLDAAGLDPAVIAMNCYNYEKDTWPTA